MEKNLSAVRLTLWVERVISAVVVLLLPGLPYLLNWYRTQRPLPQYSYLAILIAFYCCAIFVMLALFAMDRLLRNILAAQVFVTANTRYIRQIQWYCAIISLICLPASFFYAPLWFMVLIMAFLSLVICVVARVMDAAIAIREENDLTI